MEVGLVGVEGGMGGPGRYTIEMYKRMPHNRHGIRIHKLSKKALPILGPAITMPVTSVFEDFGAYDIVHNLPGYSFTPRMREGSVLVTTAHEFQYELYPELNENRGLRSMLWNNLVIKQSMKTMFESDYLIANSIQTGNEALKLGFSRKRLFVATHGIDERFLTKLPSRRKGNEFKVGYLGSLTVRKNAKFAIEAFKILDQKDSEMELWGDDFYGGNQLNKRIGGDKRIRLMGHAKDENLVRIYDSFDAFVFPSTYEGCGLTILEAKARGLPVILYKKGHISSEVRRYCFEAENENKMADILYNILENGYNEKMQKRAMEQARAFTWQRTADLTIDAYLEMI